MKSRWKKTVSLGLAALMTLSLTGSTAMASDFEAGTDVYVLTDQLPVLSDEESTTDETDAGITVEENAAAEEETAESTPEISEDAQEEPAQELSLAAEATENKAVEEAAFEETTDEETAEETAPADAGDPVEAEIPELAEAENAEPAEASAEEVLLPDDFDSLPLEEVGIASDGEPESTGTCGENVTFKTEILDENGITWYNDEEGTSGTDASLKLTISGSGAIYDYSDNWNAAPWADLRWRVTELVIESGITRIGDYSLSWFNNVKTVTIPDTVIEIGEHAFSWEHTGRGEEDNWTATDGLRTITIPSSVTSLGWNAFADNEFLETILYDGDLAAICPEQTDEEGNELSVKDKLRSAFQNTAWYEAKYGDYPITPGKELTLSTNHSGYYDFTVDKDGYYRFFIDNPDKIRLNSWMGYNDEDWNWHHMGGRDASEWQDDQEVFVSSFTYSAPLVTGRKYHLGISVNQDGTSARTTMRMEYIGTQLGGDLTESIHWVIEDGILVVSGSGEIPDDKRPDEWNESNGAILGIRIEDGITSIGANVFRDLNSVQTVEIAASVTKAGWEAFAWLNSLQEVTYHGEKLVDITPETDENGHEMDYWDRMWTVFPGDWMDKNFRAELILNQTQPISYDKWLQTLQEAPNGEGYYKVTIKNPDRVNISSWIGYHDGNEDGDDWHHINGRDARMWNDETQQEEIASEYSYYLYLNDDTEYEINARIEKYGQKTDRMTFSLTYLGKNISGSYASGLSWKIDENGQLSISGKGEMPDEENPWLDYNDSIYDIEISEGITRIGRNVFRDLYNVRNDEEGRKIVLEIPSTVTEIESDAFWNTPVAYFRILGKNTELRERALGYWWTEDHPDGGSPYDAVIIGYPGSMAFAYASMFGFTFQTAMEAVNAKLSATAFDYTKKAITPKVTVTLGSDTLTEGKDYEVYYSDNVNPGTAHVEVVGINAYDGVRELPFTILEQNTIKVSNEKKTAAYSTKKYTYKLSPSVKDKAKLTYKSSSKYVTISSAGVVTVNAKAPIGLYTITITSAKTAAYSAATQKTTLTIVPTKAALSSVTNVKGKKATVKWKKVAIAGGYEIQYSTDKNFKKSVTTKKVTKNSTVSLTLSKLTKNKTYYVRIRTYKTVSKKNYYSDWSAAKKVTIKK